MTEAEDISVGNRLATARKKKRLRYKKISSELNIEESYLIALEEENYDRIPGGEAYVKGFLRSYAKKLNLDPDEIISQYLLTRLHSKEGNSVKQIEKGIEEFSIHKNILFLFTALLILSIFMFFFLKDEADSTEIISKTYSSEVNEEINLNNEVIQKIQNIENNSTLSNEEDLSFKNLKPDNKLKDQINDNKIPVSRNIIEIFVYDDCWIEVFSESERLLYRLSQSGETYTFIEEKIKIIAGNYKNLRVSFNDKIVDLGINANANQVSCVVLPLGDCSEFRTTNN